MKTTICTFIGLCMLMNYGKAQKSIFGITAGATFASYKISANSISITSKTKTGFTVGIMCSAPMGKHISFEPALNFLQKGGTNKEEGGTDNLTLNYVELPLNFVYNTHSSKGNFFVGAGPSLSMGLSGKDKWDYGGESGTDDIKFGSGDEDNLKAFEAGINFLAGYRFKGGFLVAANYNAGLSNITNNMEGNNSEMHNRYFGVRLGYMIQGKSKK